MYICFLTSNESYSPLGWLLCEFSISRAINAEAQYGQGCKQSLVVFFWQKSQEAYNKNKILKSFWVNQFSFFFSIPYLSEIKPNLGQICDARLETCFAAGVTAPCSALPLGEHQSLGLESRGWSQLLRSDQDKAVPAQGGDISLPSPCKQLSRHQRVSAPRKLAPHFKSASCDSSG